MAAGTTLAFQRISVESTDVCSKAVSIHQQSAKNLQARPCQETWYVALRYTVNVHHTASLPCLTPTFAIATRTLPDMRCNTQNEVPKLTDPPYSRP